MGSLKAFYIALENPQGVFLAGQTINGKLVVELDAEMKVREIKVRFKGEASVYFTIEREEHDDYEEYFKTTILLFGKGAGMGDDNRLPPGRHDFPFSFQLPQNLPSSFEEEPGFIRYTIKGTIDRPWKFDLTTKIAFTVVAMLDLNTRPNAALKDGMESTYYICCLCCKSGPIETRLMVDRVGYVPGEAINFIAEIENMSRRVCEMDLRLWMYVYFYADGTYTSRIKEVGRVIHPDIQPGETENWSGDRLIIPPIPPSSLNSCRIIDIKYSLELCIMPSGPTPGYRVSLPVIIGTIPLHSSVKQYQTNYGVTATELTTLPQSGSGATPMSLPSPRYSEYVFGKSSIREKEDSKHTMGELDYAPMYTYYNMSNKPVADQGK